MNALEKSEPLSVESVTINLDDAWTAAIKTVEASCVPKVTSDRPCEENDFREYKCFIEENLKNLKILLHVTKERKEIDSQLRINTEFLLSLLILCSEHNSLKHWSTTETVSLSHDIMKDICQLDSCSTIEDHLVGSKAVSDSDKKYSSTSDIFKLVLLRLRPKLSKNTWKHYPAAVAAFQWLLCQVKFPFLTFEKYPMVFTTSLLIIDDYVSENKIIGIKCLQHYMDNITKTDFRANGRDVVIYDALFINIHVQEPEILECLLPCILTALTKMEPVITTPDSDLTPYVYRWDKFDDILDKSLSTMMMERNIKVRLVYIKWLPSIIEARGIRVVHFATQMITVIEDFVETSGPFSADLITSSLKTLLLFMNNIKPRLHAHAYNILLILLKKLHVLTKEKDSSHLDTDITVMIQLIGKNVKFLIQTCPGKFEDFSVEYIKSLGLDEVGVNTLTKACVLNE